MRQSYWCLTVANFSRFSKAESHEFSNYVPPVMRHLSIPSAINVAHSLVSAVMRLRSIEANLVDTLPSQIPSCAYAWCGENRSSQWVQWVGQLMSRWSMISLSLSVCVWSVCGQVRCLSDWRSVAAAEVTYRPTPRPSYTLQRRALFVYNAACLHKLACHSQAGRLQNKLESLSHCRRTARHCVALSK